MSSTEMVYEGIHALATASVIPARVTGVSECSSSSGQSTCGSTPGAWNYLSPLKVRQTNTGCTIAAWSADRLGEETILDSGDRSRRLTWEMTYVPRTELGKKLLAIRIKAISKGLKLLTEDEVLEEIRCRRESLHDHGADTHLR